MTNQNSGDQPKDMEKLVKNTLKFTALLPIYATLFSCGGGGPATPRVDQTTVEHVPVRAGSQRAADGVWFGSNGQGSPAFALVAPLGMWTDYTQFFFADNAGADSYLATYSGYLTLNNNAIESTNVIDLNGILCHGMRGYADASNTLSSEFYIRRNSTATTMSKYRLTYSVENNRPPRLDDLHGNYSRKARTLPGYGAYDTSTAPRLAIDSKGGLVGELRGCILHGDLNIMDPEKNLYSLNLYAKPDIGGICAVGADEVNLTGLASLVTLPNDNVQSLIFSTNGVGRGGKTLMLAGSVPKQ
ncbi:hypothetical protein [Duganella violaceipulchra]|uniref:Uncharacterized protein n=1 Tax=Duganella violaceipulchra TaxID=2849652 RepID=A0AA41H5W9_9BURK|nr:hypothetical protein [Duganella violaceicalia]MBV6322428.1 hypothetical protein [Duganella violaceicalia]MCP2010623.1 hypothetical protein [Duganella violaceicalia]